jgi:hypothetical protein
MTEFRVIIYNKKDLPVGYIDVYLVDFSNGNMLPSSGLDQSDEIAWGVRSFPIKYRWLSRYGNLEGQLNQYKQNDNNSYPVSIEEAVALTEKFSAKLTSLSHLWEDLAIRWPTKFLWEKDNKLIYLYHVIKKYEILKISFFNHQHFEIENNTYETISWDLLLRDMLMSAHKDPYEIHRADNKTDKIDVIQNGEDQNKFISFEEISKRPPVIDEIFQFNEIYPNLSAMLNNVLSIYEIDEGTFVKEVNPNYNYDYNRSTAKFIFLPLDEKRINSGIFLLLEGNQTKLIYFSIRKEDLEYFTDNLRSN